MLQVRSSLLTAVTPASEFLIELIPTAKRPFRVIPERSFFVVLFMFLNKDLTFSDIEIITLIVL